MLEVEVLGVELAPDGPGESEVRELCGLAAASRGVRDGHVAVQYVTAGRIAELNRVHRARPQPTDVLSFPIDGAGPSDSDPAHPPRELGDIVICPEHTVELREAVVHGMLHLLGMDHETDGGEMLALQDELLGAPPVRERP